jgi:hypothetical protein
VITEPRVARSSSARVSSGASLAAALEHLRERLAAALVPGAVRSARRDGDRGLVAGTRGEAVVDRGIEVLGDQQAERDAGSREQHGHHAGEHQRELQPQRNPAHRSLSLARPGAQPTQRPASSAHFSA